MRSIEIWFRCDDNLWRESKVKRWISGAWCNLKSDCRNSPFQWHWKKRKSLLERKRESAVFRKWRIDRVNAGLKVKWRKQIDGWVIVAIGRRWNIYEWLSIVLHESDFFNAFFDPFRDKIDKIDKIRCFHLILCEFYIIRYFW